MSSELTIETVAFRLGLFDLARRHGKVCQPNHLFMNAIKTHSRFFTQIVGVSSDHSFRLDTFFEGEDDDEDDEGQENGGSSSGNTPCPPDVVRMLYLPPIQSISGQ